MMRAILLTFFVATLPCAQIAFAQISGRVLDPSGSVVPDARVSIAHRSSMSRAVVATRGDGRYSFASLRAGEWLIEAHANGFGSSKAVSVDLLAGEPKSI